MEGTPENYIILLEPAWPCSGGGGELKGPVALQAGAPLLPSGPGRPGPERTVTPGTLSARVLQETGSCGPLRRCHPCKWALRAACARGPRRLGRAGRALPGLLRATILPLRRRPAAEPENGRLGCPLPSRGGVGRGRGVPARTGGPRGLLRLGEAENTPEGKTFPLGLWLQCCCLPRGPHSCVAVRWYA